MKHVQLFELFLKREKEGEELTPKDIMSLPAFISIEKETGYEMISHEEQILDFDFVWAFPIEFFIHDQKELIWKSYGKHTDQSISIWKESSTDEIEVTVGTFFREDGHVADTKSAIWSLENIKEFLNDAKIHLISLHKIFKENGIHALITPEEREQYRGKIKAKKFNF